VFALPNVFHFFAHKLASLRAGRFAFALIFARAFNWFFLWHNKMFSPLAMGLDVNKKAAGFASRRSLVPEELVLSSRLLTAALLTATLFLTLALLTLTLLFITILLLSALLSGASVFARFVWILLCFHDAFLDSSIMCLGSFARRESPFLIKSAWKTIWTETPIRGDGWLSYQAKPYWEYAPVTVK